MSKKFTAEELIEFLKKEKENSTIEGELLKKKMIRDLYKVLGEPKEKDFPEVFNHARCWKKFPGFTTEISFLTENYMKNYNNSETDWHIQRASMIKARIVEEYTKEGWHCEVQSMNVLCNKYVKHPKHKNLWVRFYVSRDAARYEYIILDTYGR